MHGGRRGPLASASPRSATTVYVAIIRAVFMLHPFYDLAGTFSTFFARIELYTQYFLKTPNIAQKKNKPDPIFLENANYSNLRLLFATHFALPRAEFQSMKFAHVRPEQHYCKREGHGVTTFGYVHHPTFPLAKSMHVTHDLFPFRPTCSKRRMITDCENIAWHDG